MQATSRRIALSKSIPRKCLVLGCYWHLLTLWTQTIWKGNWKETDWKVLGGKSPIWPYPIEFRASFPIPQSLHFIRDLRFANVTRIQVLPEAPLLQGGEHLWIAGLCQDSNFPSYFTMSKFFRPCSSWPRWQVCWLWASSRCCFTRFSSWAQKGSTWTCLQSCGQDHPKHEWLYNKV